VARTFAPVLPIFHQVLGANQMVPTTLKYYETHKNMSFGSNGVDRVRSLRKIDATSCHELFHQFDPF